MAFMEASSQQKSFEQWEGHPFQNSIAVVPFFSCLIPFARAVEKRRDYIDPGEKIIWGEGAIASPAVAKALCAPKKNLPAQKADFLSPPDMPHL